MQNSPFFIAFVIVAWILAMSWISSVLLHNVRVCDRRKWIFLSWAGLYGCALVVLGTTVYVIRALIPGL